MNETSSTPRDWLEAELEDTLDELYENEFSEPMLTEEIRKIYKDKHPDMLASLNNKKIQQSIK